MVLKQLSTLVCLSCLVCTAVICGNGEGIADISSHAQFNAYDAIKKGDASLLKTALAKHTRQLTKETITDYTEYAQAEYASLRSQFCSYHTHSWALLTGAAAGCVVVLGKKLYDTAGTYTQLIKESRDGLQTQSEFSGKIRRPAKTLKNVLADYATLEKLLNEKEIKTPFALTASALLLGVTFRHWREQVSQRANLEKKIAGVQDCLKTLTLFSQENKTDSTEEKIA